MVVVVQAMVVVVQAMVVVVVMVTVILVTLMRQDLPPRMMAGR